MTSLVANLLVLPLLVITPVHKIEVQHFGHGVWTQVYDNALGQVSEDNSLDGKIRVIEMSVYWYTSADCYHEAQWAAVPNSEENAGYTVFISPKIIGTKYFPATTAAAFDNVKRQQSEVAYPTAALFENCGEGEISVGEKQ